MEPPDVLRDHLRLHVHLAPRAFQRNTRDFLHEELLESKLVIRGDAWDGGGRVFWYALEHSDLARDLAERLHRKSWDSTAQPSEAMIVFTLL